MASVNIFQANVSTVSTSSELRLETSTLIIFYGGQSKLPTLLVKPKYIKQRVWRLMKEQLKDICAAFSTNNWVLFFLLIHKTTYIYKAVIPEFLSS